MSEDISNTDAPKLLPYFLILFGMSAGLSSVITLGAEFKQELGFSNFEIGLTIFSVFAASFIALITL
jgi:ABC-type arginine transport system permease subunit